MAYQNDPCDETLIVHDSGGQKVLFRGQLKTEQGADQS